MSTFTAYPTVDGHLQVPLKASWAAVHDPSDAEDVVVASSQIIVRGEFPSGLGLYNCSRIFQVYDLSAIPASVGIISATLDMYSEDTEAGDNDHGTLQIYESLQASAAALVAADYDQFGATLLTTPLVVTADGAFQFVFNDDGKEFLKSKLGGNAMLCIRTKLDVENTTPTTDGRHQCGSLENGFPERRPLLTIEFASGGQGFI